MKQLLRPLSLCAIACLTIGSAAQTPHLQKTQGEAREKLPTPTAQAMANAPAQSSVSAARAAANASSTTEFVLIDEDFSGFAAGTPDEPLCTNARDNEYMDIENVVASYYVTPPGAFIDPSLTQETGWSGDWVYQAGGTALLYGQNGGYSRINTPMGDYSGDITVKARIRAIPSSYTTSEININPIVGGINNPDYAKTDDPNKYYAFRLRDEEGWVEITYTYRNYQADADGFIMFAASGAVEIDWVKVTCNPNDFIAEPTMKPITNVTDTSMTLNWDPVDRAFTYNVWLWKVKYLSDEDAEYSEDFEGADPLVGSEWKYSLSGESGLVEGEGFDGSRGLKLYNGDIVTAPEYMAKFYNITAYVKAQKDSKAYLYIDFKNGDQWTEYGYLPLYYFGSGDTFDLDYEMWGEFALNYGGVRLRIGDLAEGEYVVIDDLYAKTTRPSELELQCLYPDFADEPELQDYWYGEVTGQHKDCFFTLTDLDPLGDYYYKVVSKRIFLLSESTMHRSFVIASPALEEASDIDSRGSYTANWEPVAKADSYTVINYGAIVAKEDGMMTILEEDFDKIGSNCGSTDFYAPVDLENWWGDLDLDQYTTLPGWTSVGTSICKSGMGVVDGSFFSTYIATPVLYLVNNDWIRMTLRAYGNPEGDLSFRYGDLTISLTFDENGMLDGYVDLNISGKDNDLRFYASDYGAFVIDYLKIEQEVKAGDAAVVYLGSADVDGETGSYTFDDLADTGFDQFAFTVVAHMTCDGITVDSDIVNYMLVDLENGSSSPMLAVDSIERVANTEVSEIARYNLSGVQVDENYQGIVIIRYNDGSARKVMQK